MQYKRSCFRRRDVEDGRFAKMNSDCTKPSVAPKPRFVCHSSLKLPSPLMSAARGPKPFIAPKPKVTPELNGNHGGCINGSLLTSEGDEAHETENTLNRMVADKLPAEQQLSDYIFKSPQKDVHNVSLGTEDDNVTEEEKEEEEDFQKEYEDWRLTDSALTEEVDSLETLWVSDVALTADSEEAVEMVDTNMAEDMNAEGLDAGEALADTDGISVGDISVNGIDEDAGCFSAENKLLKKRQKTLQVKEDEGGDCTADDLTESLTDESELFINDTCMQIDRDGKEATDCDIASNIQKFNHDTKQTGETLPNTSFYGCLPNHPKQVCNATGNHAEEEEGLNHEPYYISSEDIINREMIQTFKTTHGQPESHLTQQKMLSIRRVSTGKREKTSANSEDYVEIANNRYGDENHVRTYKKWTTVRSDEPEGQTAEALLNHLDSQPRCRQVSISLPTDPDTSLGSFFSESQLHSPTDSDISRDEEDLEGHIVPFLDDTTDTDQDISNDHVYEEPGHSFEGENVFLFDKRSAEMCSHTRSQWINNNVPDMGVHFVLRPYKSGFGKPTMSSSPMLSSTHRTHAKTPYLSLYPRSLSMEGQDTSLGVYGYREGTSRQGGAICSSGSFSRCSTSGLSTPTSAVDIPPPFELAYITKRPITKSSPSLFTQGDSLEKQKKKKSIKHFLMLKFGRKTESKSVVDINSSVFKSATECSHQMSSRLLDLDRRSISGSPQFNSRSAYKPHSSPEAASKFLFYEDSKRKGNSVSFLSRSVVRVESFEDRSRVPFIPLPLTKPRSISFPNTDTSDYENVPAINSDYENVQVPQRRPVRHIPVTEFFDRPNRGLSSANETDGYVDMSSLPGFMNKMSSPEQETESAYTEAYNVCSVAVSREAASVGEKRGEMKGEDQGRTSEEEDGGAVWNYERQADGRSRAFYIAKELVDTERLHVKALKRLQEVFQEAVRAAHGNEGEPFLDEERLREILNELPDVYTLHCKILNELEDRLRHWDESQTIADVFLSKRAEFLAFTTYIGHYDRSMTLLEDSCRISPAFAAIVHRFEQSSAGENVSLKHQLLKVVVRVAQYRMLLTDYLNNLSPDSKEYEDTQAAVAAVSDIADQANDSLKDGENLLRLVNIDYSICGQRDLLQPGRVFVKEGTLMKVSRKSQQPRHLFLMNDVLLYTYPQQDGKYRMKNTLQLIGLKISKPIIENVQNALRIEATDISITLSAGSFIEREDWFYTISRTVTEHTRGSGGLSRCSEEARDRLRLSLGEKAPTLVPVSQAMMCMNCTSDFSLTLRRHHCYSCGRIVCRSCSKNRYPLKYMKDRMAKVCDHCYNELKKRGDASALSSKTSPHSNRSTRPLSAVFQNIHTPSIWRHRKGTVSFNQVSEEGSISGSLHRSRKSKRSWKQLWFLLKDKVLYTYRAQEEKVASESLPLLGFTVKLPNKQEGEDEVSNIFQLYHKNTLYYTFKAVDNHTAQRWVNAMEEATVL
ncbi:FYVE, RhoGEF and PH domain-containing protein 5b isoform X1 [Antennarius striatus]|uniref:FYVE, RhoGEF and PH domain-containing protein 5b isoform X1 n=1 Tax=Antennarius striatus TaxID=241820 RepID=UPI0035B26069